jgi:hypothetical protein
LAALAVELVALDKFGMSLVSTPRSEADWLGASSAYRKCRSILLLHTFAPRCEPCSSGFSHD